jgi:hypothetical protein
MKTTLRQQLWLEFKIAAKECPGLFFAPIIGMFKHTNAEWGRVFAESRARWNTWETENAEPGSGKDVQKPA